MTPWSVFLLRAFGWGLFIGMISGCASSPNVRRRDPVLVPTSAAAQVLREPGVATRPAANLNRRRAAATLMNRYGPALIAAPRHTIDVPTAAGGSMRLGLRRGMGPGGVDPGRFASLDPVEDYQVRNTSGFVHTPGVGVPLVATLRPTPPVSVPGPVLPRAVPGVAWAVTALPVVYSMPGSGETTIFFDLYDPRNAAPRLQLAADYSTPLAVTFAHFAPQKRGFRGFLGLNRNDFLSTGLYATEVPTTAKTPVVFVHGLISDPTSFHDLQNRLEGDSEVRRHYQIWIFYYPTSLPVAYSATELREDLELFIHQLDPSGMHPALHRAVLVGHSMGGLLCRLAVTEGGDRYYGHFFRQPINKLHVTAQDRVALTRTFYGRAAPDVAQVVFISTPHRGSRLTGGLLGACGRLLVRVPLAVRTQIQRITATNRAALKPEVPLRPASSIKSLSPQDPVILAINDLPTEPNVKMHSILGNRGRDGPREHSSDGAVTYESSHLPQAESEVLVPAGHTGMLKRPETAAEIIRILHDADGGSR